VPSRDRTRCSDSHSRAGDSGSFHRSKIPQFSDGEQRIQICSPGTGTYATTDPIFPGHRPSPSGSRRMATTSGESRPDSLDDLSDSDNQR
jgi:hypothetical protein